MDATIVIPTKNGGSLLDEVLNMVFNQKTTYQYEVICVDSGSTDDTKSIIGKYPCQYYEILPSEFGHGKTRNYGASKGTGEFILFITQDAKPVNEFWLQNFIDAMKQDSKIAGGFGRHLPYPECNELDKRDLKTHFDGFGTKNTVVSLADRARYVVDEGYRHFLAYYSDNNSCMRRSVWKKYPYDDVDFAEDQIWARKMIELGYKKLYCNNAMVYHSHNYPLNTYFNRYYDEYKSLYRLHGYQMFHNVRDVIPSIKAQVSNDFSYINGNEEIENKRYWKKYALIRDSYRCFAGYISGKYHSLPEGVQDFLDRHISQQYKQINGKKSKMEKKKIFTKEFWKWLLLNPDLQKKEDIEAKEEIQSVDTRIDVCGFFDFVMKHDKVAFDKDAYLKNKDGRIQLNWIIPEMGAGSGGHINIFRFIKNLRNMGFKNRIYVMNPVNLTTDEMLRDFLREHFDMNDDDIEVYVGIERMGFAHATFATSWITAYALRDFDNTISKFYFVQDFEPMFYAVGSEYMFAENTYRFGFRGITAGDWLKNKLHDEYGMKTDSFGFSYDNELYVPGKKRDTVKRVFFYARPVTARRAFELGLLALNELTRRMPEVEVIFAGWDVSGYKIDFTHLNAGTVKLAELSDLYAQCDLCLVLSNTNLSLLPLEVMASNSVAVCSKGAHSSWLVNEENAVMVDFDANQIADTLEYYLTHEDELDRIRKKGVEFASQTSWIAEAEKVRDAIERGIREDEESISTRW